MTTKGGRSASKTWTVRGADPSTGEEFAVEAFGENANDARHRVSQFGLLTSSTTQGKDPDAMRWLDFCRKFGLGPKAPERVQLEGLTFRAFSHIAFSVAVGIVLPVFLFWVLFFALVGGLAGAG